MSKISHINPSIDEAIDIKQDSADVSDESSAKETLVLHVPKPNVQVIMLGLVAVITLFQTFQLARVSAKVNSVSTKVATPAVTAPVSGDASSVGSNADVPQSMVGGC